MKLIERINYKGRIVESDSSKLPKGVLCRVVYPVCNINERNHNNRIYERAVWDNVLMDDEINRKMNERCLYGAPEHPESTSSNLKDTSHIITKMWIDEAQNKVFQEMDVLDTFWGRFVNTLMEAGCNVGVSTRADGELEESEDDK